MEKRPRRTRDALVLPAVLLTVSLLEEVATYKVRQVVHDVHLRALIVVAFNGVAFTIAAEWITPAITQFFTRARRDSARRGGTLGLALFFFLAYGSLYFAYLVDEKHGPGWLLPFALR
jgi:hypothetical protein